MTSFSLVQIVARVQTCCPSFACLLDAGLWAPLEPSTRGDCFRVFLSVHPVADMSVREQELLLDQLPTELSPCPAPHSSNPRPSYWQTHYQSPLEHHNADRRFPSEQVVDVVIIGSGITGTSIAADLIDRIIGRVESRDYSTDTRSAIKIVVLEAREFCSGATGACARRCVSARPTDLMSRLGFISSSSQWGTPHCATQATVQNLAR